MTQNRYIATVVAAICLISLAACGGGGGGGSRPTIVTPTPEPTPPPDPTADPAYHLNTARFTTHQPKVLEQIGAHHAYARGLTGRGVRIGIEDDIVDYTQDDEFGNRVRLRAEDGANLAYLRPEVELFYRAGVGSDAATCVLHDPSCRYWVFDSEGNSDGINSLIRSIVEAEDWPLRDDSRFIVDDHYDVNNPYQALFRWYEVPSPYDNGDHGTMVASVAAGRNLGVAYNATIIPIAKNFEDQGTDDYIDDLLQRVITQFPSQQPSMPSIVNLRINSEATMQSLIL